MHETLKGVPDQTLISLLAAKQILNAEATAIHEQQKALDDEIVRHLSICFAPPGIIADGPPEWPADAGHPDLVRPSVIARREGCSIDTILRRCRDHGVGRKYGKQWRVSLGRNELWKRQSNSI